MKFFIRENPLFNIEELYKFEHGLGITLPEDYKAHLLTYNDACTADAEVFFGHPEDGISFFYFYPVRYGK